MAGQEHVSSCVYDCCEVEEARHGLNLFSRFRSSINEALVSLLRLLVHSPQQQVKHTKLYPGLLFEFLDTSRIIKTHTLTTPQHLCQLARMCHGHIQMFACQHQGVTYHPCMRAANEKFKERGYCDQITYRNIRPTDQPCRSTTCRWSANSGSWTCCECGQGPNTRGWCTMPTNYPDASIEQGRLVGWDQVKSSTCNHGCCPNCRPSGKTLEFAPSLDIQSIMC